MRLALAPIRFSDSRGRFLAWSWTFLTLAVLTGCGGSGNASTTQETSGESPPPKVSATDSGNAPEPQTAITATDNDPFAPPTDAQVIRDTTSKGKDILEVIPSTKPGNKSWNSVYDQYFWERGLVIRKKSSQFGDLKDVVCEIGGFARYEITGGRYQYREFKTLWVQYEGVPRPTDQEVLQLINDRRASFFRGTSARMVNEDAIEIKMAPADQQKYTWHTPTSLSLNVQVHYDAIVNNTQVAQMEGIWEVRLYRDDLSQPWSRLISSKGQLTELKRTDHSAEEVREMVRLSNVFQDKAP